MIIRKPYAFLIKHFKKIHIFLLILCGYIYYKNMQLRGFINEFISLGTYDAYNEPITKYVSFLVIISMLLVIIGSVTLVILLRHKEKPWKLYILPIVEYTVMLIAFIVAKNFFNSYTGGVETTVARAVRDILFITSILEYPVIAIILMRIIGLDLHKFNFTMDKEYLELDSKDREELEININIDKESFKRGYKRLLRNINYVYQEHKLICNIIILILFIILAKNTYTYIFVTHKAYKQGDVLNANGYTITINNSYYTDKDYKGDIISKKSDFIVLDLTIKNNAESREIDLNKFHIMNGINNYITTNKTYETEFKDYGKTYQTKELKRDETINFIMIFKVDKNLRTNRFVLYYQEITGANPYLRKIKLNINDVSQIKTHETINIPDDMTFEVLNKKETVNFEDVEILPSIDYTHRICTTTSCGTKKTTYTAKSGYTILKISFSSTDYEGKDMIDFSTEYGKIKYIDSKNKERVLEVKNPIDKVYYGKYLYITVPDDIINAKTIEIEYTVRNNKYIYKLR